MDTNDAGVEQQADATAQVDQQADNTDWKAKAIEFETKFKAENGIRRRLEKDLKQTSKTETQTETQTNQASQGFDYAKLAYLESKGITHPDDQSYLEQIAKDSKMELKDILGKGWVQSELKERQTVRATADATPSGTKRAGQQTRNDVEYWLAKGELPKDNAALARKVVNARLAAEQAKNQFSDNPVVKG